MQTLPVNTLRLRVVSAMIRAEYPDARAVLAEVCAAHGWTVHGPITATATGHFVAQLCPPLPPPLVALAQVHLLRGVVLHLASVPKE